MVLDDICFSGKECHIAGINHPVLAAMLTHTANFGLDHGSHMETQNQHRGETVAPTQRTR